MPLNSGVVDAADDDDSVVGNRDDNNTIQDTSVDGAPVVLLRALLGSGVFAETDDEASADDNRAIVSPPLPSPLCASPGEATVQRDDLTVATTTAAASVDESRVLSSYEALAVLAVRRCCVSAVAAAMVSTDC